MFDQEKYKNVDINGIETNINGKSPEKIAEYSGQADNEWPVPDHMMFCVSLLHLPLSAFLRVSEIPSAACMQTYVVSDF